LASTARSSTARLLAINDGTQAAFRAHNEDIDYVTIRNLVIRNMPQQGIHAYYWMSDHWTIEYNEIASNKWVSNLRPISPSGTITSTTTWAIPRRRIPPSGAAATGDCADNTTFDSNEIAYNGREQKVGRRRT
jgi:hypothetical protein